MEIIKDNKWKFPDSIVFEEVPHFLKMFDRIKLNSKIIFDLSETENIHSSFIGFLLYAKRQIEKEGGELDLIISQSLEKLFSMLNLGDYWVYAGTTASKSA